MNIAVASGKGGTGKTTVSVSLALSVSDPLVLLDCDVEEPNSSIFLGDTTGRQTETVTVPVPVLDESKCTACGECGRFCEFNAIVCVGTSVMVFPELCHSCGGCIRVCPHGALHEEESPVGELSFCTISAGTGSNRALILVEGVLTIGKAMSPPVIRAVKRKGAALAGTLSSENARDVLTIMDSPPGTSCPMTTTVSDADVVILVTEPTPFGLHDLDLAVQTVRKMKLPFGVVINRSDSGDDRVREYCKKESIPLLLEIPEDRRIAEGYSSGIPLVQAAPEYREQFARLARDAAYLAGVVNDGRKHA